MSAPALIDGFEFARAGQELRGSLDIDAFKRLDDVLFDSEGSVDYEVKGERDVRNRPQLAVTVSGTLHLQCQRCLGSLDYEVGVESTLLLVERDAPYDEELDDPEAPDMIEANPELDVLVLIEDEILLSLPLAPRHPDGACESRLGQSSGSARRQSAFASLEALKGSRNKH